MIKNVCHEICYANTRNELIDYLNSKSVVIEVTDSLLKEFELNKEYKSDKSLYKFSKAGRNISGLALFLGLFNPSTTIPTLVILAGTTLFSGLSALCSDFKDYAITSFFYNGNKHTLLIKYWGFNDELDTIKGFGSLHFSQNHKCPKCKHKLKVNKEIVDPICCEKCGTKTVFYYK